MKFLSDLYLCYFLSLIYEFVLLLGIHIILQKQRNLIHSKMVTSHRKLNWPNSAQTASLHSDHQKPMASSDSVPKSRTAN